MGEVWRMIPFHLGPSQEHFEASDALVRTVEAPTLWWHSADQPTLILGTSQQWTADDRRRCSEAGVLVVKRQSGGTAVLALADVLGLDVALPKGHQLASEDIVEAYRWIGEVWLTTVQKLGVDARLVRVEEARASPSGPAPNVPEIRLACFGSLSPYEVAAGDRKLVGLAQVRRQAGVLLQSALHLHFDASGLAKLLPVQNRDELAAALDSMATGLDRVMGRPVNALEVMEAFQQSLQATYGMELHVGGWEDIGPTVGA